MVSAVFLIVGLLIGPAPVEAQQPDPEREARAAARRYESLLRRRAPYRFGGFGGPCHEIIGRFCFRFGDDGTPDPPPPPEHPDVAAARRLAVRAHRRWLSAVPADVGAAGGLIRYLIQDDRAGEAVSVARTHAWASGTAESLLLLGLAHHYTGDFVAAEAAFDSARSLLTRDERDRLDDVGVLLDPAERGRYEGLGPAGRRIYHARFWAFSDPSIRVPGNERRSAHYARHAWSLILAGAPRAAGMLSWGDDQEEILLRYGMPRSRERIRDSGWQLHSELNMVELYDPHAVSLVPPALLGEGVPRQPPPGVRPELERDTVRSSYAPIALHRVRSLDGQVTRVPTVDGWVLRVDAPLPPDTVEPRRPVAPTGLLVAMDTLGRELARAAVRIGTRDSTTVLRGEVPVPPGPVVYHVELTDDSTGLAGVARYRTDVPEGPLALSDPLLARATVDSAVTNRQALDPFPTRVLALDEPVLVYAEVRGLLRAAGTARYAVEWWLEPRDTGSFVGRAFRWMARWLGLGSQADPVRVRWDAVSDGTDPVPITFVLDLAGAEPGRHRLGLTVTDRLSDRAVTSVRTLLLTAGASAAAAGRN